MLYIQQVHIAKDSKEVLHSLSLNAKAFGTSFNDLIVPLWLALLKSCGKVVWLQPVIIDKCDVRYFDESFVLGYMGDWCLNMVGHMLTKGIDKFFCVHNNKCCLPVPSSALKVVGS